MTEQGIAVQAATLGEALLTGIVMGIYYDFFRIIRRIIRCRYANIVGQDIFFWVTSAIFVFFTMIKLNGGVVRIFFAAAVLGGWALYITTAGAVLMIIVEWVIRGVKLMYSRLHNMAEYASRKVVEKRKLKQKTKKTN